MTTNSFTVSSKKLRVTDPCYDDTTWCAGNITKVKNGVWNAEVTYYKDATDLKRLEVFYGYDIKMYQQFIEDNKKIAATKNQESLMTPFYEGKIKEAEERLSLAKKNYLGRVAYLRIRHSEVPSSYKGFIKSRMDVGVDSGQAGFFDHKEWLKILDGKQEGGGMKDGSLTDLWYKNICTITCGRESMHPGQKIELGYGCIDWGTVSLTGMGDGGYNCYVRRVGGEAVEAYLEYIRLSEYGEVEYENH